jgi:hypothetical protein
LITLRLDGSDKLAARNVQRKIKEVEKLAAKYADVPTIPRGGGQLQSGICQHQSLKISLDERTTMWCNMILALPLRCLLSGIISP